MPFIFVHYVFFFFGSSFFCVCVYNSSTHGRVFFQYSDWILFGNSLSICVFTVFRVVISSNMIPYGKVLMGQCMHLITSLMAVKLSLFRLFYIRLMLSFMLLLDLADHAKLTVELLWPLVSSVLSYSFFVMLSLKNCQPGIWCWHLHWTVIIFLLCQFMLTGREHLSPML